MSRKVVRHSAFRQPRLRGLNPLHVAEGRQTISLLRVRWSASLNPLHVAEGRQTAGVLTILVLIGLNPLHVAEGRQTIVPGICMNDGCESQSAACRGRSSDISIIAGCTTASQSAACRGRSSDAVIFYAMGAACLNPLHVAEGRQTDGILHIDGKDGLNPLHVAEGRQTQPENRAAAPASGVSIRCMSRKAVRPNTRLVRRLRRSVSIRCMSRKAVRLLQPQSVQALPSQSAACRGRLSDRLFFVSL